MKSSLILAIDVGASSAKASLYDAAGQVWGRGREPCAVQRTEPGLVEQDPEVWWGATVRAARSALAAAPANNRVEAIAVSSTNALVMLDQAGRSVRPAIMQLDSRASAETTYLRHRLGAAISRITGNRVANSGYWLPVLRWLCANEPQSLARTHTLVYPNGYVVLQLAGARTIDRTRAATTQLFDVRSGAWSDALVREAGLHPTQLPGVVESTDIVGSLHRRAAAALGLPDGIPVAAGAMDSVTGALGMGLLEPGDAAVMLGTVARVGMLSHVRKPHRHIVGCAYPSEDLWWSMGALWSAGAWLQWIADTFYSGQWDSVRLAERPEALAPLMAVCPRDDRDGAITGLRVGHRLEDIGSAGVVGVLAELADTLDRLARTVGQPATRVGVCGRSARLAAPTLANLLGASVEIPVDPETETRGGAILAACAARLLPDVTTAVTAMVPASEACLPGANWSEYRAALRSRRRSCQQALSASPLRGVEAMA
jgi:xylulokinase